jgi:hypothetical protein
MILLTILLTSLTITVVALVAMYNKLDTKAKLAEDSIEDLRREFREVYQHLDKESNYRRTDLSEMHREFDTRFRELEGRFNTPKVIA